MFGALGGACAALLVVWAVGAHPGRTEDQVDRLRADMVAASVRTLARVEALGARLDAMESRTPSAAQDPGARDAVVHVAEDLSLLRDSIRMELSVVDEELRRLAEIVDDVVGGIGGPDPTGPLSEEDEPRWVVLASDPEPGVRFSALVRLGRARTGRSVQASLARLDDPATGVVWQALRNLGRFRERGAAARIVELLSHGQPVVRSAAHDALLRLGAPTDTGYDAVGPEAERVAAIDALRAWAEQ